MFSLDSSTVSVTIDSYLRIYLKERGMMDRGTKVESLQLRLDAIHASGGKTMAAQVDNAQACLAVQLAVHSVLLVVHTLSA